MELIDSIETHEIIHSTLEMDICSMYFSSNDGFLDNRTYTVKRSLISRDAQVKNGY